MPGYFGTDSFTYAVSDGHGGTDNGLVTVQVTEVEDPPPDASVLVFPGVQATAGTTVNRLSDFFTPAIGTGIEITLAKPLGDSGNIGVFCQGSNENHYEAATVGVHRWGLTSVRRIVLRVFVEGVDLSAGTGRRRLVHHDLADRAAGRDSERQPLVRRRPRDSTITFESAVGSVHADRELDRHDHPHQPAQRLRATSGSTASPAARTTMGRPPSGPGATRSSTPGDCFIYSWRSNQFRPWLTGAGTFTYSSGAPDADADADPHTDTDGDAHTDATPTPTPTRRRRLRRSRQGPPP